MMLNNNRNANWLNETDHEQCRWARNYIKKSWFYLKEIQLLNLTGTSDQQYISTALSIMETQQDVKQKIRAIRSAWSSYKTRKKNKGDSRHLTIRLSIDTQRKLEKLTKTTQSKSWDDVIDHLIKEQYKNIILKIKANNLSQNISQKSSRYSSENINFLEHNKVKNKLKSAEEKKAQLEVSLQIATEQLAFKEKCIESHLKKIAKFVDQLNASSITNANLVETEQLEQNEQQGQSNSEKPSPIVARKGRRRTYSKVRDAYK
ncbi:hypothetical protein [Shewanella psychrotolerans]|uniref:hypothetical protein n=1 Tax=Shewanella psychrotolerans TaxID=2864206 RepID=UPI001C6595EA|nr:hypothetical protein [Shewanella psychrotolerans]QYK01729.1 hypothetical protein K0I62_01705 [Shewanella psychrotolerans]